MCIHRSPYQIMQRSDSKHSKEVLSFRGRLSFGLPGSLFWELVPGESRILWRLWGSMTSILQPGSAEAWREERSFWPAAVTCVTVSGEVKSVSVWEEVLGSGVQTEEQTLVGFFWSLGHVRSVWVCMDCVVERWGPLPEQTIWLTSWSRYGSVIWWSYGSLWTRKPILLLSAAFFL